MKFFLTTALSLLLGFTACKTDNKVSEVPSKKTTETKTDLSATKKSNLTDPDTTDTIPPEKYGVNTSNMKTAEIVRTALLTELKDDLSKNLVDEASRKFIFFEYDLNDDNRNEILAGMTGPYFCGTGGCTIYLFDNKGSKITVFTVSDFPVVIDKNKSGGWKDLIIKSNGKNHLMKFNGKTYPTNPSVQPEFKMIPGDELPRALDSQNEPYPKFKF